MMRAVARLLERGVRVETSGEANTSGALKTVAAGLSQIYGRVATRHLRRPLCLPRDREVFGIGGALLGGVGKTLVVIGYARELVNSGRSVAVVSHGYGASLRQTCRCWGHEAVDQVGDDTLLIARALKNDNVSVWVGRNRNEALEAASRCAQVIVMDGTLQSRPRALAHSVLVVSAENPWGCGQFPPLGDWRVAPTAAWDACDEVVIVRDVRSRTTWTHVLEEMARGLSDAAPKVFDRWRQGLIRSAAVDLAHPRSARRELSWSEAARGRFGLISLMAHPERVSASLMRRGVTPIYHWQGMDHGKVGSRGLRVLEAKTKEMELDGWLCSSKCRTHLGECIGNVPVWEIPTNTWLDSIPVELGRC